MAYRRDSTLRQLAEVAPAVLEPGEAIQAAVLVQRGPSPYLIAIPLALGFGAIAFVDPSADVRILLYAVLGGLFGAVYWMVQRPAVVAVTDRRVLFWRASFWAARPVEVERADPRAGVAVGEVKEGSLWNRLTYRKPDGTTERFNVGWNWRDQMRAFVAVMATPPQAPPPPAPPAPLSAPPHA